MGAQFALGQPVPMRGGLEYLTMPAHLGQFSVFILHTSAPDEIRCRFGRGGMVQVVEFHEVLQFDSERDE